MILKYLVIIFINSLCFQNGNFKTFEITIPQGRIRGDVLKTRFNQTYWSFQGIPYAKPPIGDLRFKAPVPLLKWNGTLDGTKSPPKCAQYFLETKLEGSEDCLYLSVATVKKPNIFKKNLPVMVWIHGGAFAFGSGRFVDYNPNFLLSQGIVYVSINYRVNSFGFLSISNNQLQVPGNAGLKDQILALKWIQNSIKYFGGDPNSVTVFGESAGGASTSLLLLSPMSKGLFNRVIYQSGSPYCPWVIKHNHLYENLLELLNCTKKNEIENFNCLNEKSAEEISIAENQLIVYNGTGYDSVWRPGPVIESNESQEEKFLSESPSHIIVSKKFIDVPIMAGYVTDEGALFYHGLPSIVKIDFTDNRVLVPDDLSIPKDSPLNDEIGEKVKQFYYKNSVPSDDNSDPFVNLETDAHFFYGTFNFTRQLRQYIKSPIYFYNFNYHNYSKYVYHGAELSYLFDNGEPITPIVYRMVKFWTNFVKYGNVNPTYYDKLITTEWIPLKKDRFNYLLIDEELEMVNDIPRKLNVQFWDEIYQNYSNYASWFQSNRNSSSNKININFSNLNLFIFIAIYFAK